LAVRAATLQKRGSDLSSGRPMAKKNAKACSSVFGEMAM